jgi:lysozyme family protein
MDTNFAPSLKLVLAHEGGYVNHPKDPGGETNKGVTKAVYDAYRRGRRLPVQSVRLISDAELQDIYRVQYWDAAGCGALPLGLDYATFDLAVNSGVTRARLMTRGLIGTPAQQIEALCDRRMAFLKGLSTWSTFGLGWTRRVIGQVPGAQVNDCGVVDYATTMALAVAKQMGDNPVVQAEMPSTAASIATQAVAKLPEPRALEGTDLAAGPKGAAPTLWQTIAGWVKH